MESRAFVGLGSVVAALLVLYIGTEIVTRWGGGQKKEASSRDSADDVNAALERAERELRHASDEIARVRNKLTAHGG